MYCSPQVFRESAGRAPRAPAHDIPDGFVALREVKSLPLLGRWPLLDDRMPAWLPFDCLREMARRNDNGDEEAREWIDTHRRAVEGDPGAQLAMAITCETGRHGAAIDLQRALFWYWRASLSGDRRAHENAMRLKESIEVAPGAIGDPALLYPGQWRIMRDDPRTGISTWIVTLLKDGAFMARATARIATGRWTYNTVSAELTLAMIAPTGEVAEYWDIQLLGAKDPLLFGRDGHRVTYIVQRVIVDEDQAPQVTISRRP
jgi:TPR repeat protein